MVFELVANSKIVGRIADLGIIQLPHIGLQNQHRRAVELELFLRKYNRRVRRQCRERDNPHNVLPTISSYILGLIA